MKLSAQRLLQDAATSAVRWPTRSGPPPPTTDFLLPLPHSAINTRTAVFRVSGYCGPHDVPWRARLLEMFRLGTGGEDRPFIPDAQKFSPHSRAILFGIDVLPPERWTHQSSTKMCKVFIKPPNRRLQTCRRRSLVAVRQGRELEGALERAFPLDLSQGTDASTRQEGMVARFRPATLSVPTGF